MRIEVLGHTERVKWDLSNDGKYIYFIDRIFEPEGAWKVVHITDSMMVLNRFSYSSWEEVEMKLRRMN